MTLHKSLPTLLEIKDEVGQEQYDRMMSLTVRRMNDTFYKWMPSCAKKAYIFEEMQHLYEKHQQGYSQSSRGRTSEVANARANTASDDSTVSDSSTRKERRWLQL